MFKAARRLFCNLPACKHRRNVSNFGRCLVFDEYGDPLKVTKCLTISDNSGKKLQASEVLVKVLMSPVNPADINLIQGTYAVKPQLPAVGGNEGICEVLEVGSDVKNLKVGSWVIPKIAASFGLWTELIKCQEEELFQHFDRIVIGKKLWAGLYRCYGDVTPELPHASILDCESPGAFKYTYREWMSSVNWMMVNRVRPTCGRKWRLISVPNDMPVENAATMAVNPCTAYRMLKDFVRLEAGDTVILNAANSGVGIAVIQIAKVLGLNTVCIIRSRENEDELKKRLENFGATKVLTDSEMRGDGVKKVFATLPKAKLALNAVGGKSTIDLCKYMEKKSTMVTYGGMSRQPLMIPVGSLIFNDIAVKGYWMTRWISENYDSDERYKMMEFLGDLTKKKQLLPPVCEYNTIEQFRETLKKAMEPFSSKKQIFVFDKDLHCSYKI